MFKKKSGQPLGTTLTACPRPKSCPDLKFHDIGRKQQFFGQADKDFYIAQKHFNIEGKAILSERICARIENPDRLSVEVKNMREKQIEQKFVKAVKNMGGIAPKLVCPGFDGMPDRIVLLPDGRIAFVEVKAMSCKPRPLQLARQRAYRSKRLMHRQPPANR